MAIITIINCNLFIFYFCFYLFIQIFIKDITSNTTIGIIYIVKTVLTIIAKTNHKINFTTFTYVSLF